MRVHFAAGFAQPLAPSSSSRTLAHSLCSSHLCTLLFARPSVCSQVRPSASDPDPPKDANDALLRGNNLRTLIEQARPIPHKEILTFSELRHELRHQLKNPEQAVGTQYKTLPSMNKLLKGHRRGELTVLTGESQISSCACSYCAAQAWCPAVCVCSRRASCSVLFVFSLMCKSTPPLTMPLIAHRPDGSGQDHFPLAD